MRDYGIISMGFWTDEKVVLYSDQAKILALYFLAGPHSNIAGAMRVPVGYIADDLKWTRDVVDKSLNELIQRGFINRCANSSWTLVKRYLSYNRPDNPNQWKAVDRLFASIPGRIIETIEIKRWLQPFAKQLPNTFGIQEQEQEQEQDKDGVLSDTRQKQFELDPDEPENPPELDPLAEAVMRWNDLAADIGLAKVTRLTDRRKKSLRLRLDECGGLDGWSIALDKVRASTFLRGETGWKADFDFLMQASSFTKLMEGSYDRNRSTAATSHRNGGKPSAAQRVAALYRDADPGSEPSPDSPGRDGASRAHDSR